MRAITQRYNPKKEIVHRLHYQDAKKTMPVSFSDNEIIEIIETIKDTKKLYLHNDWGLWMKMRDMTMVMMGLTMGLRPREICWAKFDDFNLDEMTFTVRGENNKQRKGRVIPLPRTILPYLKAYLKLPRTRFWKGSPYLFPSMESEKINPNTFKTKFRHILQEAGIYKPGKCLYSLRHTCLSKLYNKTKDGYAVANLAGHSKIYTWYFHKDKAYMEYEREALDNLFEP